MKIPFQIVHENQTLLKCEVYGVGARTAADGGVILLHWQARPTSEYLESGNLIEAVRFDLSTDATGYLASTRYMHLSLRKERTATAEAHLTSTALAALEDARHANGDLAIAVCPYVILRTSEGIASPCNGVTMRLDSSQWLKVAKKMKWLDSLTVEVPLGGTAIPPAFADAVDEFKEAVSLARQQRYVESIGRCRRVLEALDEPPFGPPPNHQEWASRMDWSWMTRLAFMYQGLRHALHAGPHRLDGDEPGREDTQMMLNMVGSLLRFIIRNESASF